MGRLRSGVDRKVGVVADDGWVGAGGMTSDGWRDAELFNVLADDFLAVDTIDRVLSHAEEKR